MEGQYVGNSVITVNINVHTNPAEVALRQPLLQNLSGETCILPVMKPALGQQAVSTQGL